MGLKIKIHKLKSIESLNLDLPVEKGLYAITGQNGCGKSTVVGCASAAFYDPHFNEYFGHTENDSYIELEYNGNHRKWYKYLNSKRHRMMWGHEGGFIGVNGFFEGSLIFGNRFKDTSFDKVKKLDRLSDSQYEVVDSFITENLGWILQGNKDFYNKLYKLTDYGSFKGDIFFYELDNKKVSQFHMSTGENLLISILNSLSIRNKERSTVDNPCIVLLDEIEFALHPASLKRLLKFMKDISEQYNYAVYFSTHSLEIISQIAPSNLFYLKRYPNNKVDVINPCYPAFATKMVYEQPTYDKVFLVEDDLAKTIVEHLLQKEKLRDNRTIFTLPVGGWTNVLEMANEVVTFKLFGNISSIGIILDGDIKSDVQGYIKHHGFIQNVKIGFLPINSLEKFLWKRLYSDVDTQLYQRLESYIFQRNSIEALTRKYESEYNVDKDKAGKWFYAVLEKELKEISVERVTLVSRIVEYLFEKEPDSMTGTIEYLKEQLGIR